MILDWVFISLWIAGAVFFLCFFVVFRRGALPVNSSRGLRTEAIMQSPDVWKATHKRVAPFLLFASLICCGLGVVYWMGKIGHLLEPNTAGYLRSALTVLFPANWIGMLLYSNRFAKEFARKQTPPTKGHE